MMRTAWRSAVSTFLIILPASALAGSLENMIQNLKRLPEAGPPVPLEILGNAPKIDDAIRRTNATQETSKGEPAGVRTASAGNTWGQGVTPAYIPQNWQELITHSGPPAPTGPSPKEVQKALRDMLGPQPSLFQKLEGAITKEFQQGIQKGKEIIEKLEQKFRGGSPAPTNANPFGIDSPTQQRSVAAPSGNAPASKPTSVPDTRRIAPDGQVYYQRQDGSTYRIVPLPPNKFGFKDAVQLYSPGPASPQQQATSTGPSYHSPVTGFGPPGTQFQQDRLTGQYYLVPSASSSAPLPPSNGGGGGGPPGPGKTKIDSKILRINASAQLAAAAVTRASTPNDRQGGAGVSRAGPTNVKIDRALLRQANPSMPTAPGTARSSPVAQPAMRYVSINTANGPAFFQRTPSGLMAVSNPTTLRQLRSGAIPTVRQPAIAPGANRFANPSTPKVGVGTPSVRVNAPGVRPPTPRVSPNVPVNVPVARPPTPKVTPNVPVKAPVVRPPTVRPPTVRPPTVRPPTPTVKVQTPAVSDVALKRDIVELGRLANGLRLYRYRYLWSDTEYVGVMAQEVLGIAPEAVVRGADGYLRVDYARLGLRLMTWEEWIARGAAATPTRAN